MSRDSLCFLLLFFLTAAPLNADEPGRVDCHGDPLPGQAVARLGTIRFVHGAEINCLAYSLDGKMLASGGDDGRIHLWETQSGRKISTLKGHAEGIRTLAFSPSNKLLVSASDNGKGGDDLRLWNVATGEVVFQLAPVEEPTTRVVFAPDGKTIATAHLYKAVRLWDAQTGKLLHLWSLGHPGWSVSSIAFTPDGNKFAVAGSDRKIRLFELSSGKELLVQQKPTEDFHGLAFSPDGTVLAASNYDGVWLYRASTLAESRRLDMEKRTALLLAFSPDGKTLITGGHDEPLGLWDVDSGKHLRQLAPKDKSVKTFELSPDGKTLASVDVSWSQTIQFRDAQTGLARPQRQGYFSTVSEVLFLSDGETVAARVDDSQAVLWPHGTGKESSPVALPKGSKQWVFCSDRSTLAITTKDGALLLLDMTSGRGLVRCPIATMSEVLALSADKTRAVVLVGDDYQVEVWDLAARKAIHRFQPHTLFRGLSPDGHLAAMETGQAICVWDLETKKQVCRCQVPGIGLSNLTFTPDGRMMAAYGFGETIHLWETASGQERLQMQGHSEWVESVVFSPDGKTLASGSKDRTVRLWDVWEGKELHAFPGHLSPVNAVDFSPDGRKLVSGSSDSTALIWDIPASCRDRKLRALDLGQRQQQGMWDKLAETDAASAYVALRRLAAAPADAVSLCAARLPLSPTQPKQIQRWILQLDDDDFDVREQASQNLERVEGDAQPALESALKGDRSPEARQRMKAVLQTMEGKNFRLRVLRAVELLEQIGTPEAVILLRLLAQKTPDTEYRSNAQRSLRRLSARRSTR